MHTRAAFWELHKDKTLSQERRDDRKTGGHEDTRTRAVFGHRYRYLCYFEILILTHTHTHIFEIVSFS